MIVHALLSLDTLYRLEGKTTVKGEGMPAPFLSRVDSDGQGLASLLLPQLQVRGPTRLTRHPRRIRQNATSDPFSYIWFSSLCSS